MTTECAALDQALRNALHRDVTVREEPAWNSLPMPTEATAVIVCWKTDQGLVESRGVYTTGDLLGAVTDQARALEKEGRFLLGLHRVFTQPVPLVGGQPSWVLAGKVTRVPEGMFAVRQEMGDGL